MGFVQAVFAQGRESDLLTRLLGCLKGEETEELGIDMIGDPTEVLGVVAKLDMVAINDEQVALVVLDPVLVLVVKSLEVVELDLLLIAAGTLLDLRHERRHGGTHIDEQVGHLDERGHEVEQVLIVVEVAIGHESLVVEVGRKDAGILVNSTILDDVLVGLVDLHNVLEALVEEIDLEVERPACHVGIEIRQIRIVLHALEARLPAIMFGQHVGQRCLTTADITCYCNMHARSAISDTD